MESAKDRILFIAPRYHTNFRFQIKKLIEERNEVKFISIGSGAIENYDVITPVIIGLSKIGEFFNKIFNPKNDIAYRNVKGIPKLGKLYREVLNYNPDYIITRSFNSTYFRVLIPLFLIKRYKIIIYIQNPKYVPGISKTKKIYLYILNKIFNIRFYTTVNYLEKNGKPSSLIDNKYYNYIPFFIYPQVDHNFIEQKDYIILNILHIGKYIKRKNHELVISVFKELREKQIQCKLTLIGESNNQYTEEHLSYLKSLTKDFKYKEDISFLTNIPNNEIDQYYKKSNLFLLLSIDEPASISQIEAMSYGLPVICSIDNGTAHYVKDGENGFIIFPEKEYLLDKIQKFSENKNLLREMSIKSLSIINGEFNIENNYKDFIKFLKYK